MLAVIVLWLATIVGFVPAVVAQSSSSTPFFLYYYLTSDNKDYRLASYVDNKGLTNIFLPNNKDSLSITNIIETKDFKAVSESVVLSHLIGVIPLFIVFDKATTNDFVIGFKAAGNGFRNIARLPSKKGAIDLVCSQCIDRALTGEVITSWDTLRNNWISVDLTSQGKSFVVSTSLNVWNNKVFLPNIDPTVLASAIEIFPIADDDDASKVTWILVRKSNTDPPALVYGTFVPDDANPQYNEMGILDVSRDFFEFAVINGNSTDYRHRRVVAGKRIEYRQYGVLNNIYLSPRVLSFSGGKLRQMPISTIYPTPTYEQLFPSVSYLPGVSVFSCLPPSVALAIEGEMKPNGADVAFGFDLFISEASKVDVGVIFTIDPISKTIALHTKYAIFAAGPVVPENTLRSLALKYEPDGTGIYKVLIVVDTICVEYFIMDGLYVGSTFAFPKPDMTHHEVFSSGSLDISNMRVRIFK